MDYSKDGKVAGFTTPEQEKLRKENETVENGKGINNHIKAAEHFALASKHHYESARLHEEGQHGKAHESALFAIGHASLANEYQTQDSRHHILEG